MRQRGYTLKRDSTEGQKEDCYLAYLLDDLLNKASPVYHANARKSARNIIVRFHDKQLQRAKLNEAERTLGSFRHWGSW